MRRRVGAIICLAPIALLATSLGFGIAGFQESFSGIVPMGIAAAIALFNLWHSFGRPWMHLARGGNKQTYRHVSGLPMIGTLLTLFAASWGFGAVGTAALGLFVLAIDTGGSPWFLAATWNDESLWAPARARPPHGDV